MFPRDEDEQRQLIYEEQVKTNTLLEHLIGLLEGRGAKTVDKSINVPKVTQVDTATLYDEMKRPALMKEISKLENTPKGWNTWSTNKMRDYLKEAKK